MDPALVVPIIECAGAEPFSARWHLDDVDSGCRIELAGAMCTHSMSLAAPRLLTWIDRSVSDTFVVDLGQVDFIDGRGVSALLEIHDRGTRGLRRLRFDPVSPIVRRLLDICGLTATLGIAAGGTQTVPAGAAAG